MAVRLPNLSIDKKNRQIAVAIALKGEVGPVRITLNEVRIIAKGRTSFLSFKSVTIDREWMNAIINTLLELYAPGNRFEIPRKFSRVLKLLI